MNKIETTTLDIQGMTCSGCAATVARQLQAQGCEDVQVDLANAEATFKRQGNKPLSQILQSVNQLGYEARPRAEEQTAEPGPRFTKSERLMALSAIFTLPLLLPMIVGETIFLSEPVWQWALATPVYAIGLWQFGRSAYGSLRLGAANMDVLVVLGTTAAYGYSLYGFWRYGNSPAAADFHFFETAATIVTLILVGNILEHRSVTKTTTALKDLGKLQVKTAWRMVDERGRTREVPVKELRLGDKLQVNEGGAIPADGLLYQGEALVDEAMITGESEPVPKKEGDRLTAGTIVQEGHLQMEVDRLGADTTLSQIVRIVKEAQQNKPQIQKLGDKISAVFVPVVVGIAILTFGLSYAAFSLSPGTSLLRAIAVLVIACPCAMGLATPTAIMVGLGKAARQGILIKGAQTLELLAQVKTIVFDKTGTLTTGRYEVRHFQCKDDNERPHLLAIVHALEAKSNHPVAAALRQYCSDQAGEAPTLSGISEQRGYGLSANDAAGHTWRVGSFRKVEQDAFAEERHDVYLLCDGQVRATFDLEDEIKPGAEEAIAHFKKQGIRTVMLSGDRSEKCEVLARRLALDEWQGELLPEDKLARISNYTAQGRTAMVGDGINDAPALARADVGISFSGATEVSMSTAQVVLLSGKNMTKLIEAWRYGKATLTTIKQNLFWAFFYNVLAIPVAAAGFLSPMIAALSMAFSDVIVIGNSLRLRLRKLNQ